MSAFNDATCGRCGRRFGWTGEMKDRPKCPRCGHRPPQKELDEAQREMDKFREELRRRNDVKKGQG